MIILDKPRDSDIHTLADFSELLCLVTQDRVCSRETISDQIKDVGESKVREADLDDCFSHIEWRSQAFGDYYPFTIDTHSRTFSAPENLSDKQRLYSLLLLCANLPFLENRETITDAFERIALVALKSSWPTPAKVRAFGKNETDYIGAKWERINTLASQIGGRGLCTEGTFRTKDSGDGGIDLVAWLDMDPFEPRNIPSALGQCACSRNDWVTKQTEISRDRLNGSIHPSHPWMQVIFIPHSFRNNHGAWAVDGEIASTIIFDRLRILNNFADAIDWNYLSPPPLFNNFLDHRLELV